MTTENRQLTVYLSKSLLMEESNLQPIRDTLIGFGFKVTEYNKDEVYTTDKMKEADFVLFVPLYPGNEGYRMTSNNGKSYYEKKVGRGQHSEAEYCVKNKLDFVYHNMINQKQIFVSKLTDKYTPELRNYVLAGSKDWKKDYASISSYVMGKLPVSLYDFVEGYFKLPSLYRQYPLTSDKCYQFNPKLLLL